MTNTKPHKNSSTLKKTLIEWGLLIAVFGGIYISGYGPEVIGTLQRGLLATGIFRPDTTLDTEEVVPAQYNFTLMNEEGESIPFSDFRNRTVFLNFWATWCAPCIAEMPNIQKLYTEMKEEPDLVFVMLSLDENPEAAKAFMERKGFDMPVYFLKGRRPGVYNSTAIPTTYVISSKGEIVLEKRGMSNYNTRSFKDFLLSL